MLSATTTTMMVKSSFALLLLLLVFSHCLNPLTNALTLKEQIRSRLGETDEAGESTSSGKRKRTKSPTSSSPTTSPSDYTEAVTGTELINITWVN